MTIKQSLQLASLILTLSIIFAIGINLVQQQHQPADSQKTVNTTAFAEEFRGAYPVDSAPNGNSVEVDLVAQESSIELIPNYQTSTWSYNGITPAPEIRLKLGDTLKINLNNKLNEATTIHFHGIRVPNEMDGVPDLTQNAVEPGGNFSYQFTPKDPGTYWFHPHFESAEQMERGLYGVIVVEDQYSELYSQDQVWVIDDWLIQENAQIYPNFVTAHDLMHDGRWGNVITVNSNLQEQLLVQPGERIRLRLVNTSNARIYKLNFGTLNPLAIAVDGMYVKDPFDPNHFELAPGNRLDLDITIPADSLGETFTIYDSFSRNDIDLAQIVVNGNAVQTPDFLPPTNPNIPNWDSVDYPADITYELDAQGGMMHIKWGINGEVFPNISPKKIKKGDFKKIKFKNNSSRLHPMHIHGQFFKVLSRNGIASNENYFRDTVLVHPRETVEVGMVATDDGAWANHCHILEHAEGGMMTTININ